MMVRFCVFQLETVISGVFRKGLHICRIVQFYMCMLNINVLIAMIILLHLLKWKLTFGEKKFIVLKVVFPKPVRY